MMHDEATGEFWARASGSVGCEIIDPDGEIVAWTADGWWAATIVGLLNGAEERGLPLPRSPKRREVRAPSLQPPMTTEEICRENTTIW
jgi:hypothetical protein